MENDFFRPKKMKISLGNIVWNTKMPKGFFIFFARKIHFPFSGCPKGGFFVKELPNNCCKNGPNQFHKILGHI